VRLMGCDGVAGMAIQMAVHGVRGAASTADARWRRYGALRGRQAGKSATLSLNFAACLAVAASEAVMRVDTYELRHSACARRRQGDWRRAV
ncbi:MAG: hypothetical protein KA134_05720, partial [Achromobacter sp.]|nr:hypothetical protein [Achromobacter sp.]